MDTMPCNDPMEKQAPLSGLDPADLLRQGAAEDTFADGASTAFQPPAMEEIAAAFPQLEILELIGQGGMGAVYKVRQKDLDRIVALKILPPAIGQSPESSHRFTREARALAKLNHPGIVTIYEFGQQNGLFFILMEFVDGVNLAQLMKTGRVSPREALAIVPQVCDALQYAHDQGIVHRDIKPENILLDRRGRVKVADFGIAKVVAAASDPIRSGDIPVPVNQTLAGNIIGTPQYMAPEQISNPSDVDHRADIYALGVVFYQMLTGELPGKDLQAPSKKVHIDVRLDEIVLRAMEKRPEMRYQTAHELRTVVDGFPAPVHSQPPSLPLPAPKRGMMRRWWWVFLMMIPLGPIIGLATGAGSASLAPKKYETAATIEIRRQNVDRMTPGWVGNEFEKLTSRRLLADVADQLDLPANWQVNRDDAVGNLKGMITVENIRGTDLMRVRVRHTNNEQAVDIVNGVVSSYQRSFGGTVIVHDGPLRTTFPVSPSVANVRLLLVVGALGGLLLFPLMAVLLILILNRAFPEKNPADVGRDPELGSAQKEAATRDITAPHHRKSPFRSKKIMWILAVCLVTGVLWMTLGKSGRSYPVSSTSSAFKTPVMGRIEFKYTHAESTGGMGESYDVKIWGDTQWKPSSGMAITLKDGQSLQFKSRVNAMNPDSPMAMVTTSSDNSNWETKVLRIDGKDELQELVFSNGLRVKIQWSPVDSKVGNSEPPDPIQQGVMRQASKWSDEMHPVKVDDKALSVPPQLVFIGLQHPSKERWHPDGSSANHPQALAWMREIGPIYAGDMSKGETIRGMEFWFAHPLLEPWQTTEIEFLDESGAVATRPGRVDGKPAETDGKEGRLHWSLKATPVDISKPLNVRLNYTIGPLERVKEHIVEPHASGSTFKDGNTVIASVGQTAGGSAFLALAVDEATQSKHRFGVEAVTKDGEIIHHGSWSGGSGPGRPNIITYQFGVPISEVAKFRIGTRPLRSAVWKNVATSAYTGTPTELVVAAAAEVWLAGIDAGEYGRSWKNAAAFFQKSITEAGWGEEMTKFRQPLGEVKSREFVKHEKANALPGAPDGEYFVMQFETSFSSKEKAVETVTVVEEDGIWKACGYYIR